MRRLPGEVEASLKELPRGLREHVECVRGIAREIASLHSVDRERVDLAAASHDLARALGNDALLESARGYGIQPSPVHRGKPVLLHGPVAAEWLEREAGIEDTQVLEADCCHSNGRAVMGLVQRLLCHAVKLVGSRGGRHQY